MKMDIIYNYWKTLSVVVGGLAGWAIAEFKPMFPLDIVAVIIILYDAWTAYQLDRRVRRTYPNKVSDRDSRFTSFAFGKVIRHTIPKRLFLIFLAYIIEHWVFIHIAVSLSYIVTGAICFEQAWSVLENESSCRNDSEGRFWRLLQSIMIDKTERHFDINLSKLKDDERVTDEQIDVARKQLNNINNHEDNS